ncbi:MAG: hypothetical protein WDN04_22085 [Rhodospirillales bacterium]
MICAWKALAPAALAPVFQKAIHVEIGDQRADHAALRHASLAGSPTFQASLAIPAGRVDRRFEPKLDQTQHVGIDNAARQAGHQLIVRDAIEILAQIGIDTSV